MLVTFKCKTAADITMFGDVAVSLLRLMGQSGGVPGALLADDVTAALEKLKAGVASSGGEPAENSPPAHAGDGNDAPAPITIRQRAFPLIRLLEAAARARVDVIWEQARNPLL